MTNVFLWLGSFGWPVAFRFLNEYDILKNDGLIILLLVRLFLSWHDFFFFFFDIFSSGLPLAILCNWGSSLANVALFALLFPVVNHFPHF